MPFPVLCPPLVNPELQYLPRNADAPPQTFVGDCCGVHQIALHLLSSRNGGSDQWSVSLTECPGPGTSSHLSNSAGKAIKVSPSWLGCSTTNCTICYSHIDVGHLKTTEESPPVLDSQYCHCAEGKEQTAAAHLEGILS